MKIVQINATYGIGSTGCIVKDIHERLTDQQNESYVFWAAKCIPEAVKDNHISRVGNGLDHKIHAVQWRILHNQGWNSRFATKQLCGKIRRIRPDVVHLHNLHSNYINLPLLLKFLAVYRIPVMITLHDCWLFTGHCTHFLNFDHCSQWRSKGCLDCPAFNNKYLKNKVHRQYEVKKKLFSGIKNLGVIGVSNWITGCGKESLLSDARIHKCVYNWIDYDIFHPGDDGETVREKYGIKKGQVMILGVSQGWSREKGLVEFQVLSRRLGSRGKIILIGNSENQRSSDNLVFAGYTANQKELSGLYSAADLFVNPSRMETFGKVTAEALACGTPVVAYDNTGTSELISMDTGILAEDGNIEEMINAVFSVLGRGKEEYSTNCRNRAIGMFNKKVLLNEIICTYKMLMSDV